MLILLDFRAQKWLRHTLLVTAIAGIGHVTTTSILGVVAIYLSTSLLPDVVVHHMSSIILCILGMVYIAMGFFPSLFPQSCGCNHHHHHNHNHYDLQASRSNDADAERILILSAQT